ncbi:DNA primase [Oxalobacter sp. OxGP1]|uniref:DNA primase n=1 Tax=Oxalobacter paeniformigenes TaxID=2946594 RepID=UPI0022AFECA6|nr:DNA primase [Oxalobacter paeniformigenes]MCZ4052302.1 DNA primase [Oxalobacter paeniformigenes]
MIPQSFIQDLLNRIDIVEVVGNRVQLKKAGANFLGLCPFHTEKTPSFTVSPVKQFYHCFGCGRHGSAITFLMEHSGLSFVEAVEELAQSAGMTVPKDDSRISPQQRARQQARTLALTEVMAVASRYYRQQLKQSQNAIAYLKKRGVSGEIALRFGLGYAPSSRDGLKGGFDDYQAKELVEAGLVIVKDDAPDGVGPDARRYDRFRDRIMFPIRNTRGQVIAFGGRILERGEPKYLNSPETPLFQKGNELYGLFEARQAIRDAGYVLVVEGYMDVVALAQTGFPQAVATLGTACTPTQVQKLMRHTDRIVFSFDGDNAGRGAARRALEASLPLVSDTKSVAFLFLPPEHDPDSYVREYGREAFEEQVERAMPMSEFLMQEIVSGNDMDTMEGRARALHKARPWCVAMAPSALRIQILKRLEQITQMPEDEMKTFLAFAASGSSGQHEKRVRTRFPRSPRPPVVGLERQVMRLLLLYPEFAALLDEEAVGAISAFSPDKGGLLHAVLGAIAELGERLGYASLVEQLRADGVECEQLVRDTLDREYEEEPARMELLGAVRQIRLRVLASEMEKLVSMSMDADEKKRRYLELRERQEALQKEMTQENVK